MSEMHRSFLQRVNRPPPVDRHKPMGRLLRREEDVQEEPEEVEPEEPEPEHKGTLLRRKRPDHSTSAQDDYQKALELGQVLVAYARVMLVGHGGVGKSSLLRGLMNLPLPRTANSTQLADLITVKTSITQQLMAKATDVSMAWVKVTEDDEIDELVGLVLLVANVSKGVTESSRFCQYLEAAATHRLRRSQHQHKFHQQISSIKNDVVREIFTRAIEQAKRDPHAQAPESEILMNVWDCAGQSVYLDILSAFLTPKTIFMLLYDARCNLDKHCIILSHHNGEERSQEQNMSYLEMLFQWMASIHVMLTDKSSGSNLDYPRIITVGTHGDDQKVKENKDDIINMLIKSCEDKAFTHLVRKKGYIINNKSAGKGDHEDPVFKEIRKEVHEFTRQSSVTIATPLAWVLFRKILQKSALTKPIHSREEALEIAISCSIPPKSFDHVLKFYHNVAVFLYFDNIPSLKDYVIASPQWLVSQLAKLLALEGFEKFHNPALWNLLRKKGILVEELYDEVWKESGLEGKAIMDLLENCCLAAPINTKGKVHSFKGKEYFVPSPLPLCPANQLTISMRNSIKTACTLHLRFNTRYVPPGYLTRLATALSKHEKCNVSFTHGIYRNQFMFDFAGDEKNCIDEVTISQHITSVQVNVCRLIQRRSHNPPFSVTCREIMKTILACSSEIEQWLPSIKVNMAFDCKTCSTNDHFIEIDPNTTTLSQLKCQENEICTFSPPQQHWLQISPREESLDSEGVLTETELQCVAEEVNRRGKLEELAEALEMADHLQGHVTAYELLQRWQSEMHLFGVHIKSHLIHHLRCINQKNTAEWLKYGQLQSYTRKFKEATAEVEDILDKINSFTVSTVTSSGLEQKNEQLKRLENWMKQTQSKLAYLPEIDDNLQQKVSQCKQGIESKKERHKMLREKICSMESLFGQFRSWLENTERTLNSYKSRTATMLQKQFLNAKAISEDVEVHKTNFNKLKVAIQLVIDVVDELHQLKLSSQLDEVTEWFDTLIFRVMSYTVQKWLENKETQLDCMARVVLPVHIRKAKEFQKEVNSFKSDVDRLSQAAISKQQNTSFEKYKDQYEILKQKVAKHISTLEQKRQWSLYAGAAFFGIVVIILGVLLIKPDTKSWNSLVMDMESRGTAEHYSEHLPKMLRCPTMPELVELKRKDNEPVRIIDRIGVQYNLLGTYLLNDTHGTLLPTIKENNENVEARSREIFQRWIEGQGIKNDWKTLVQALREGPKLNALADDIVDALRANDNDQDKQDH